MVLDGCLTLMSWSYATTFLEWVIPRLEYSSRLEPTAASFLSFWAVSSIPLALLLLLCDFSSLYRSLTSMRLSILRCCLVLLITSDNKLVCRFGLDVSCLKCWVSFIELSEAPLFSQAGLEELPSLVSESIVRRTFAGRNRILLTDPPTDSLVLASFRSVAYIFFLTVVSTNLPLRSECCFCLIATSTCCNSVMYYLMACSSRAPCSTSSPILPLILSAEVVCLSLIAQIGCITLPEMLL